MAGDSDILESWKEIAAYLKRDVTTVQRWEKREGLPVHRHVHDKSGSVFALKPELDRWRLSRTIPPGPDVEIDVPAPAPEPVVVAPPQDPTLSPPAPRPVATGRRSLLFAVGLAALVLTVGALVPDTTPEAPPSIIFEITPEDGLSLVPSEAPTISPDGTSIVFVGIGSDSVTRLHVRPIGELRARPLPGTEGARYPFWSADSRQIAFFADGRLKSVATSGGEPRAICEAPFGQAGSWSDDGVILFPLSSQGGLYQVRVEGGSPSRVTEPDLAAGDFAHRVPHFLPDGRRFLFLVRSTLPTREGIYAASLDGMAPRQVMRSLSEAWYSSGHLLFVQPPALMAQAVDLETLTVKGAPFALSRESSHESYSGRGLFSASTGGTVVYSTMRTPTMRLVTVDRGGARRPHDVMPGVVWDLAPAPGGTRLAVTRQEPGVTTRDIWTFDLRTSRRERMTTDAADDAMPVWSPGGKQMAFSSRRLGTLDIFVKEPTEQARSFAVVTGKGDQWITDWSSDGAWLLYSSTVPGNTTRSDLFAYRLDSKQVTPVVQTRGRDTQGRFSPDGRWVAYSCDVLGQPDVFVKPFPPRGDEAYQISSGGGRYPRWRADGRELYFVDGADNLVAASIEIDTAVHVRTQQVVLHGAFVRLGPAISGVGADYAPTTDGAAFLIKEPMSPVARAITVVVNGLARRPAH
jgi:eukaryotic-like serine/threonine-protein kinase